MNETAVLSCEGCGDEVAELDAEKRGPCCHNLPNPWHRGEEGLYNQPSGEDFEGEDHREEEGEEDEGPALARCRCGSTDWTITASQRVGSDEEGSETIYYDHGEFEVNRVTCTECGERSPYYLETY